MSAQGNFWLFMSILYAILGMACNPVFGYCTKIAGHYNVCVAQTDLLSLCDCM